MDWVPHDQDSVADAGRAIGAIVVGDRSGLDWPPAIAHLPVPANLGQPRSTIMKIKNQN